MSRALKAKLEVLATPNTAENVRRVRSGEDVKLATVPSDGNQAFLGSVASTSIEKSCT